MPERAKTADDPPAGAITPMVARVLLSIAVVHASVAILFPVALVLHLMDVDPPVLPAMAIHGGAALCRPHPRMVPGGSVAALPNRSDADGGTALRGDWAVAKTRTGVWCNIVRW